jgi:hypothetical protein
MAHGYNYMSSAAGIEYAIRRDMRLSITASDEKKTAFTVSADTLRNVIKNVVFTLYEDGGIESEEWYNDIGQVSRVEGPAYVRYGQDGNVRFVSWWLNGKRHRVGAPATTAFDDSGVEMEAWYFEGQENKVDGPAVVTYYTRVNGKIVHTIKQETWYINGEIHRDDGEPAIRSYFEDGTVNVEQWIVHGKHHRIGGPADVGHYANTGKLRYEIWYRDGKIHREDGPANVSYFTTGEINETTWYVNGEVVRGGVAM